MINRGAIAEYDRFWRGIRPCHLEYSEIWSGPGKTSRIVKASETSPKASAEFEVIIMGGGPWGMLLGRMLVQRGHTVLVLERNLQPEFGSTWNMSRPEFNELRSSGALPPGLFDGMVMGEYTEGIFSFLDKSTSPPSRRDFHFDEILNVSIDELKFLSSLALAPRLTVLRGREARLESLSRSAVFVGAGEIFSGQLLIDASGWTSPLASLANPGREIETVYNMTGFRTSTRLPRPTSPVSGRPIGIIGATYEDEIPSPEGPVQPILERFTDYVPGGIDAGDVVYYFTRTSQPAPILPMMEELLKRTGQIIPGFREEMAERTYYGHMPAWLPLPAFSRHRRQVSVGDRILLAGTSAFQYNGLTGCGFCSLARNAPGLADRISLALKRKRLSFNELNSIDIDQRERISMEIAGLFGGTMALGVGEPVGTVNRDWISFSEAAEGMDQHLKNEAFRDKIRLATLNQLAGICARNPRVIGALLRNNRGHIGAVIWTFISSYVKLLLFEARLLAGRRKGKYLRNGVIALMHLPGFAFNAARMWAGGARLAKGSLNIKGGSK
jgi:lycopene cyclase CruA